MYYYFYFYYCNWQVSFLCIDVLFHCCVNNVNFSAGWDIRNALNTCEESTLRELYEISLRILCFGSRKALISIILSEYCFSVIILWTDSIANQLKVVEFIHLGFCTALKCMQLLSDICHLPSSHHYDSTILSYGTACSSLQS